MRAFHRDSISVALLLFLVAAPLSAQIVVDTFAGGRIRSGVPAQDVALSQVFGMAWDASGALVFCDRSANLIRRVRLDGIIESIAGTGETGFSGDGGPALSAALNSPGNPKFDSKGSLYFADNYNLRIRRVDAHGVITSVAGDGIALQTGMDLEGPALARSIGSIADLAVDSGGNVYFIETGRNQIRRATAGGGIEVFGTVTQPTLLAMDDSDNLYVTEGAYAGAIRRFRARWNKQPVRRVRAANRYQHLR